MMLQKYLIALASLASLALPLTDALACDPGPSTGVFAPLTAPPTIIPFFPTETPSSAVAMIEMEEGAPEISGTVELLDDANAYAFIPDEALVVGESYRVTVDGLGSFFVTIVSDQPSAQVSSVRGDVVEFATGQNCCDNETTGACVDACGVECRTCWPTGLEYRPRITTDISFGDVPLLAGVTLYEEGEAPSPGGFFVVDPQTTGLQQGLDREFDGTLCIRIEFKTLQGDALSTVDECVDGAEFPDVERRELDFPELVAECVAEPDDIGEANWVAYGTDSDEEETDDVDDDDGGCSAAGGALSLPALFFAALVALRH